MLVPPITSNSLDSGIVDALEHLVKIKEKVAAGFWKNEKMIDAPTTHSYDSCFADAWERFHPVKIDDEVAEDFWENASISSMSSMEDPLDTNEL
jgi:hypothetical protein